MFSPSLKKEEEGKEEEREEEWEEKEGEEEEEVKYFHDKICKQGLVVKLAGLMPPCNWAFNKEFESTPRLFTVALLGCNKISSLWKWEFSHVANHHLDALSAWILKIRYILDHPQK